MNAPHRVSLYRQVLGARFDLLPPAIAELHDLPASAVYRGEAEVIAAENPLARTIAWITGFPVRSYRCPVTVRLEIDADGETWHREFAAHRFHSRLGSINGMLVEKLGPHRISFRLEVDASGLQMFPVAWRTSGIPLPRWFWPTVSARESVDQGRFHFEVESGFRLLGRVILYRGWLVRDHHSVK